MTHCGASLLEGLSAEHSHPAEQLAVYIGPLTWGAAMPGDACISKHGGSRGWPVLFARGSSIYVFLC